jgi:hypothetical protein
MEDFADNALFNHWCNYADQLDHIRYLAEDDGVDEAIAYINKTMAANVSTNVKHEACSDVAQTLEIVYPVFAGKFKY